MADELTPPHVNPDPAVPSEAKPVVPASPALSAFQAAPGAVKRSMPMALSICLGILLAGLAGWLFYNLTWFLLLLYLSFVAATILEAPVYWLKRHGLRRGLAAVIVMVGGLAVVGTGLYFIGSGIYNQAQAVQTDFKQVPKKIDDWVDSWMNQFGGKEKPGETKAATKEIGKELATGGKAVAPPPAPLHLAKTETESGTGNAGSPATGSAATATSAPASATAPADGGFDVKQSLSKDAPGIATIGSSALRAIEGASWLVIMFFLVLYMLVDGADHLKGVRGLLPKHTRLESTKLFNEISKAHRGWAFASAANVCSASILTGFGLFFLGVPGAFILGFFAGLGELIPNIGPFVGAMPAVLLTLVMDPDKFVYVLGMFVVVQTIQSYGISPQMLKFSVALPVLVTIVSVLVFGTLFGFLGILVAIPFVADMVVVWNYVERWREKDTQDYDRMNPAVDDRRGAMSPDNTHPSKLRKLFLRERKRAAAEAGTGGSGAGGMDRLEEAEGKGAGGKG